MGRESRRGKGTAVKRVVGTNRIRSTVETAMRIKVVVEIAIAVGIHDLISTQQLCRGGGRGVS